jgi:hypothetical protein
VTVQVGGSIATPEFPTKVLPAVLIIGLIGAILLVQKFKEN